MQHRDTTSNLIGAAKIGHDGVATFSATSPLTPPASKGAGGVCSSPRLSRILQSVLSDVTKPTPARTDNELEKAGSEKVHYVTNSVTRDFTEVRVSNRVKALVSNLDAEHLIQFSWYLSSNGYAASRLNIQAKWAYMHRIICGLPSGFEIDHINGNILDNRRENLRTVTRGQQMQSRRKFKNSRSQYKGVSVDRAGICAYIAGQWIGYFDTEMQAAKAYDREAYRRFGEFAKFNFPGDYPRPVTNINWPENGSFVPDAIERIKRASDRATGPLSLQRGSGLSSTTLGGDVESPRSVGNTGRGFTPIGHQPA